MRDAAAGFVGAGVRRGDRVAIWAPNSARWVVAALGALSAGGVLVPMNTRYRGDEAAYVLQRSGARLLVCAQGFLGADHLGMLADSGAGDRPGGHDRRRRRASDRMGRRSSPPAVRSPNPARSIDGSPRSAPPTSPT